MIKKIEGAKINLRYHLNSDAVSIFQYASDEAISRHTFIPHPYTIKDAHEFIKLAVVRPQKENRLPLRNREQRNTVKS